MKGLHQQLADKWAEIERNRAAQASVHSDPRTSHEAGERLPRLKEEAKALESAIIWGEEAMAKIEQGLQLFGNVAGLAGGAELQLSTRYLETSVWRLRRHLGEPVKAKR